MPLTRKEINQAYRLRHPVRWKEILNRCWKKPYFCVCGAQMNTSSKYAHVKSAKHARTMKILSEKQVKDNSPLIVT